MICPFCQHPETRVLESRETEDSIRRRRECQRCEKRFTTYERIEQAPITIIKKDGGREPYDREKLLKSILLACQKRPIPRARIDAALGAIEAQLRRKDSAEIPSRQVGELVMRKLRALDKVAYIRFASVYREFEDIASFESELKKLQP